jgi:hypothetical protein
MKRNGQLNYFTYDKTPGLITSSKAYLLDYIAMSLRSLVLDGKQKGQKAPN